MADRVPFVAQMELADCGAACLAMALAYHGRSVPLEELREVTGTTRGGVTAQRLIEAAGCYGLVARGVQADLVDLDHLPRGSILHWQFNHFVVFEGRARHGVRVIDPASGRHRIPMSMFRQAYTGVAVTFEPGEQFQPGGAGRRPGWRYLRPLLRQSDVIVRVLVTSVLLRLLALAVPVLTGLLVDRVVPQNDGHVLRFLLAGLVVVLAYHLGASLVRAHLLLRLRTHLDVQMTLGFVHHLVQLPYRFFLARSAGDLMMRLRSNTTIREILTSGALSTVLDGALASLYLLVLLGVSPLLGLLVLGLGLLQATVLVATRNRNQLLMAESLQAEARSQSYAYQLLAGIETLKAMGAERRAAEHWSHLFVEEVNVGLGRGRFNAAIDAATSTLRLGSPLAVLATGGFQVMGGTLSLGTMLAATALATGFLEPLAALVTTGLQFQLLSSYMARLTDVLDHPREQEGRPVVPAPPLQGHIRAEKLTFAYAPSVPPVVRDVSIEVRPGQLVALVGPSGSGKSTLAHLLVSLYEPTSGKLSFDGLDVTTLEASSLRRQLGVVTQHPYLFAATIGDNIALSRPDAPLEDIVRAAELACIDEDIAAMPLGYDTPLVDGGASLSGGQRQRIALARALIDRPRILLLDEATSALDALTEARVHAHLASLSCTAVVIAHRLSTVCHADLILVVADGQVVERGRHADLMARHGRYRELVTLQTQPPADRAMPGRGVA